MHIIHLESDSVSLYSNKYEQSTSVPLYGISDDKIVNIDAVSASIKRLISKYEEKYGNNVENIILVCNLCGLDIQKQSRIQAFKPHKDQMVTNKFSMQTCDVFELYNMEELKAIIKLFAEICIIVEKVYSIFGLFIINAQELIKCERVAMINFWYGKTFTCFFDGSGSIQAFKVYDYGIDKCLTYITSATIARFPYLQGNTDVINLVLQDFINLSEVEMVAKINRNKNYKKEVISFVNYEMARFISNTMHKYCTQMWQDISIPQSYKQVFIHSNTMYTKTFVTMCDLLASHHIVLIGGYMKVDVCVKGKTSLLNAMINLLKVA